MQVINVNENNLLSKIDNLKLDDSSVILTWGRVFSNYELSKHLSHDKQGQIYYKGVLLFILDDASQSYYPTCVVLRQDELPYGEVLTENGDEGMTEVDTVNHIYSNIYNMTEPFRIHTSQKICLHYREGTKGYLLKMY